MSYVQVKVCGITRPKDAHFAAKLGADMVGMIFYSGSKRHVDLKTAENLVAELPTTVDRVGVFVDEQPSRVLRIAGRLRLNWVQLHGNESGSTIKRIQREGYRVIKAYSVHEATKWAAIANSPADLTMLDNGVGGTGTVFDWKLIPMNRPEKIILAGGIDSRNVLAALHRIRPLVIDVNSGVESAPGIKSRVKLEQFFKVVNRERAK